MTIDELCAKYGIVKSQINGEDIWKIMKDAVSDPGVDSSVIRGILKDYVNSHKSIAKRIDNSDVMNLKFLNESAMQKYVREQYVPLPLRPDVNISNPYPEKIIFFTKGWDKIYNKCRSRDFFTVDYSSMDASLRKCMIRYAVTTNSANCAIGTSEIAPLIGRFFKSKEESGLPVTLLDYNDGFIFRQMCMRDDGSIAEKKQFYIASFVRYLEANEGYTVEPSFYKSLKIVSIRQNTPEAVSEEHLEKLLKVFKERASRGENTEERSVIMYGAILLLCTTKLRLASIISLRMSDVFKGDKEGQYYICVKTKRSNGKSEKMAISQLTYNILARCNEISSKYDSSVKPSSNEGCIFRWKSKSVVRTLTAPNLEKYMHDCCKLAGIEYINPARIRKYYMTKAYDYSTEKGFTDFDRAQMTGHTTPETTLEFYYDQAISRFIEGKYHITIGDKEILKRIDQRYQIGLDQLADDRAVTADYHTADSQSGAVVGYCRNTNECMGGGLPCWCCKSFYTTPTQIPVFLAELDRLQKIRSQLSNEHDISNIETQMSFVGTYLACLKTKQRRYGNDRSFE